jgi:hypothetical protein
MRSKLVYYPLTLYILSSTIGHAQEVGNYGYLELPTSTHVAALGGCNISVVEPDLSLSDQNPALLCDEMVGQMSVSYLNYVSDINLGYIGYAGAFRSRGAWSVSARYVDYGSFAGYDADGVSQGTFSAQDVAISGALGLPISEHWRCGGAVRMLYSSYDIYSAFALSVDLGINYYNENSGRSFSVTLSNLGGQLKRFDDHYTSLPTELTLGLTKELEHLPFCLSLTAWQLLDWDTDFVDADGVKGDYSRTEQVLNHLIFGAEWIVTDNVYFAAAYNYRRQRQFTGMGGFLRGISFGGGFTAGRFNLHASYARYNAADGSLSLGCGYHF